MSGLLVQPVVGARGRGTCAGPPQPGCTLSKVPSSVLREDSDRRRYNTETWRPVTRSNESVIDNGPCFSLTAPDSPDTGAK